MLKEEKAAELEDTVFSPPTGHPVMKITRAHISTKARAPPIKCLLGHKVHLFSSAELTKFALLPHNVRFRF